MLVEMLQDVDLPRPEKAVVIRLAEKFESDPNYLFMDSRELQEKAGIGKERDWHSFLNMREVEAYIEGQMAMYMKVSQRKSARALLNMAMQGGQGASGAAKQIQELAGALNGGDGHKTVILHYVPRSEKKEGEISQ